MTKYSPARTGGYPRISPNFQNCTRCENDLKDNKHHSFHLGQKYAQIFVVGHNLLVAHSSWKAVRFSEQTMSADKYPNIFLCQMEAIVYVYSFLVDFAFFIREVRIFQISFFSCYKEIYSL